MAKTPTERAAAHRASKLKAGTHKQKAFVLTVQACEALASRAKARGLSETQVIEALLTGPVVKAEAPASAPKPKPAPKKADPVKVQPRVRPRVRPGDLLSLPDWAKGKL